MEKKTIEEITKAVLVYCEEVCPNVGDGHKETVNSGTIIHSKDRAWVWLDGLGSRIYINDNMSRATATAMYAILGLAERDAVAAAKELSAKEANEMIRTAQKDSLRSVAMLSEARDNLVTLRANIAELQARNTALVAALKSLKSVVGYKPNPRGEIIRHRNDLGIFIDDAIATNTEKGGMQG